MTGRTARRAIGALTICLALAAVAGPGSASAASTTQSCSSGTLLYLGVGGLRVSSLPSCTTAPLVCPDSCSVAVVADYSGKYAGTTLRWAVQENGTDGWSTVASASCGPGAGPCGTVYTGGPYDGPLRLVCNVHTSASLAILLDESEGCTISVVASAARTSRATARKSARGRTRSRFRARAR